MKLMTNTGRTLPVEWCGRSDFDRNLYIGMKGISMAEAATLFGDKTETARMTLYRDEQNMDMEEGREEYKGFTEFVHLRNNTIEGTIVVGLARQEVEE